MTEGVTWCDCQVISGRCSAETPQQWPLSATDAAKMKRCGSCGSPLEAINGKWNELVVKLTPMHTCILLGWKRERAQHHSTSLVQEHKDKRPGFLLTHLYSPELWKLTTEDLFSLRKGQKHTLFKLKLSDMFLLHFGKQFYTNSHKNVQYIQYKYKKSWQS